MKNRKDILDNHTSKLFGNHVGLNADWANKAWLISTIDKNTSIYLTPDDDYNEWIVVKKIDDYVAGESHLEDLFIGKYKDAINYISKNIKPIKENDLDFGEMPAARELGSDELQSSVKDEPVMDIVSKRREFIYKYQNDLLPTDALIPTFIKVIANGAKIDKLPDGRYITRMLNSSPKQKEQASKLVNFINGGKTDALATISVPEIRGMVEDIASEIIRHIPLENDHPTRKLLSLIKNGMLDDAISFHLKQNYYDIFGDKFYNNIKLKVIERIKQMRDEDIKNKKSIYESIRYRLNKILG